MKSALIAFVTFFFLGSAAFAAEIDVEKSSIKWIGTKITGSNHFGLISPKPSELTLKDGKVVSGKVVIDTKRATHRASGLKPSVYASLVMPFRRHLSTFGGRALVEAQAEERRRGRPARGHKPWRVQAHQRRERAGHAPAKGDDGRGGARAATHGLAIVL